MTVDLSVDAPGDWAEVSPQTIVFTPENYAEPVEVSVRAKFSVPSSIDVNYSVEFLTTSDDEVFDGLSDSWEFGLPDNSAPSVVFTSPAADASLPSGADLSVTVESEDYETSVASVTLSLNGNLVREDTTAPYEWSVSLGDTLLEGLGDDLYELEATAVDSQGESFSASRMVTVGSPSTVPPAAPQGFSGVVDFGSLSSSVRLEWDDNSEGDFQSYSVYRSTSEGNYGQALAEGLTSSNYTDTDVDNGTTYFYVVTAFDSFGNESAESTEIAIIPQLGPGLTVFGSDNDGSGGFTTSAETGTEAWTVEAESYHYAFGTPGIGDETFDEAHTASLLKSYVLDRSPGQTYTIEGVVNLVDGYGDDNNRIGILLFNNNPTQTSDGGGGLYLRLNTDGANLAIISGVAGSSLASTNATGNFSGDSWIGTTITLKADLTFSGSNINVDFTFTDQDGNENTMSTTVLAASYPGNYFGFATKWRYRDASGSNRVDPPEMDYKSFLVKDTRPPTVFSFKNTKH